MKKFIFIFVLISFAIFFAAGCKSSKVEESTENTFTATQETMVGIPPNINGTIYGDINDDGILEPLSGIEITLDTKLYITSFKDGTYMLSNVSPGRHKIYIHDPNQDSGFKDKTISIRFKKTVTKDITLEK